jgi:hypothetical protein
MLATNLHGNHLISTEVLHNIMILSGTLDHAVHGEKITAEQARSSLEAGRIILTKLDVQDTSRERCSKKGRNADCCMRFAAPKFLTNVSKKCDLVAFACSAYLLRNGFARRSGSIEPKQKTGE